LKKEAKTFTLLSRTSRREPLLFSKKNRFLFILSLCKPPAFISRLYAPMPHILATARRRRRIMGDLIAAGLGMFLILLMAAYAELCERI
jgi:hypothetical protein